MDAQRKKGFGINGCIVDKVVIGGGKLTSLELGKRITKPEEIKVTAR